VITNTGATGWGAVGARRLLAATHQVDQLAPLALAVPLFAVLYKLLRARFADARRERVFAGQR